MTSCLRLYVLLLFAILPYVRVIWQEEEGGAPRRIRTADPFITNEVLYQLSYWGYAMRRLDDTCVARKANVNQEGTFVGDWRRP
jgi:hypothetical protein